MAEDLRQRNSSQKSIDSKYARNAEVTASVLFDKKWKVQVLCAIRNGPVRLGQLSRLIPGASKKILTQHLRQLEVDGIIVRMDKSDHVLHVEYDYVADSREDILALLDHLAEWGAQHLEAPKNEIG